MSHDTSAPLPDPDDGDALPTSDGPPGPDERSDVDIKAARERERARRQAAASETVDADSIESDDVGGPEAEGKLPDSRQTESGEWHDARPQTAEMAAYDDPTSVVRDRIARQHVSFDFSDSNEMPSFGEVIDYISKRSNVPISYTDEARAVLEADDTGINLRLDNVEVKSALSLLLTVKGLDYDVSPAAGGSIVIRSKQPAFRARTQNYRVPSLLMVPPAAERQASQTRRLRREPKMFAYGDPLPEAPTATAPFSSESLIAAIKREVAPHTWGVLPKTSLNVVAGKLVVSHFPTVHAEVAAYLDALHQLARVRLAWDMEFWATGLELLDAFPYAWRWLARREDDSPDRPAGNPVRCTMLSAEQAVEFRSRMTRGMRRVGANALNYQPLLLEILEPVTCTPDPSLPMGNMAAGLALTIDSRMQVNEPIADLDLDLNAFVVRQAGARGDGYGHRSPAPHQWRFRARGAASLSLKQTMLLRDVPNPFPEESQPLSGVVLLHAHVVPRDETDDAEVELAADAMIEWVKTGEQPRSQPEAAADEN